MNRLLLILVWIALISPVFGQEKESIVQQRIEFISEQLESEDIDLTDVIQNLYYRLETPLNLNSADKESLRELNLLTDIQINDLLLLSFRAAPTTPLTFLSWICCCCGSVGSAPNNKAGNIASNTKAAASRRSA